PASPRGWKKSGAYASASPAPAIECSTVSGAFPFGVFRRVDAAIHPWTCIAEHQLITRAGFPVFEELGYRLAIGRFPGALGQVVRHEVAQGHRIVIVFIVVLFQRSNDRPGIAVSGLGFLSLAGRRTAGPGAGTDAQGD